MGKKIPIVSFLCGVLTRKKTPPSIPAEEAENRDDKSDSPTSSGGGDEDAATKRISTSGEAGRLEQQQQQPPPRPPGIGRHKRTVSCQHTRSHSGVSKLVSSLSLRAIGGGGGSGAGREEKVKIKDKLFKHHEDSIWKKTIILGEKCRVPDEDEDPILYDDKGNKFSTYHPKTHSGVLSFSRQTSCIDQNELSKK